MKSEKKKKKKKKKFMHTSSRIEVIVMENRGSILGKTRSIKE